MYYHPISIVTPSFNQGEYLEEAILSVLNQNYPNLQFIIIDGGSKDNSIEIIKKYQKSLYYWTSEKDNGPYHAIQKGFNIANGSIMTYLNSDDILFPNSLNLINEIFNDYSQIKWLSGYPAHLDEKGRTIINLPYRKWSKYNFYLMDYSFIQQEAVFWKRDLWEKAGSYIDTNLKFASDLELWLRFFKYEKLYTIKALTGGFRVRSSGQRSKENFDLYIQEAEECIKKNSLSEKEKNIIKKIKIFNNIIFKIPFFRNLECTINYYNKLFDYPPEFIFDRNTQKFILQNS
jgi:glycosyltransferase involved in cell wall biosynthesis